MSVVAKIEPEPHAIRTTDLAVIDNAATLLERPDYIKPTTV
jgi:hypothetical protein